MLRWQYVEIFISYITNRVLKLNKKKHIQNKRRKGESTTEGSVLGPVLNLLFTRSKIGYFWWWYSPAYNMARLGYFNPIIAEHLQYHIWMDQKIENHQIGIVNLE